jgi:hypothetical protein
MTVTCGVGLETSPAARLLKRLMSEISEDTYCAGWYAGCEYSIWSGFTGEILPDVRAWQIEEETKQELQLLHELAHGWVSWSDAERKLIFLTDEAWRYHLESKVQSAVR